MALFARRKVLQPAAGAMAAAPGGALPHGTAAGGSAPPASPASPQELVPWAEAMGAALPPLVVAAERVAATVLQGVHGRRRAGTGDAFWQFRPFVQGDSPARIDWRQSAKGDRLFIRESEWEAAQTVLLWRDTTASMRWRSAWGGEEKHARADLLLLALASLLLRGGERVRLLPEGRSLAGRGALNQLAQQLRTAHGAPTAPDIPRHARAVLFGDFWAPLAETEAAVGHLAGLGLRGHLVQVLDPAEETLPYEGRIRFEGLEAEGDALISRVEMLREAYAERLAAHRAGLAAITNAAGWRLLTHRTDQPPATTLLALWQGLAPS